LWFLLQMGADVIINLMLNIEELNERGYRQETVEFIKRLISEPTARLVCAHGDTDPVVGIYEVPSGCVALPGVEVQPLCAHHRWSDGSFYGMIPIVDLSLNPGWLEYIGDKPDLALAIGDDGGPKLESLF
jgi:hypothetical protein